jgi:hypothetical protein
MSKNRFDSVDLKQRYTYLKDQMKYRPDQMFADFNHGWRNNGVLPSGERYTIKDAIRLTRDQEFADAIGAADLSMWIPRTINTIIKEAVEPILIGEKLLSTINLGPGQMVNLGTMGALSGDFEVSEMGELPEFKVTWGDGTMIRTAGRIGAALRFQPDIIEQSAYPVIELHVRALSRALARYQEEKIFSTISAQGQIVFDNEDPSQGVIGSTSGRDLDGSANGSMIAEDFMDLLGQVMKNGYMPRGVLMNTLAYIAFMKDPYLKWMGMNNGGVMWGSYTGSPVSNNGWSNMNGLGWGNGRWSIPANSPTGEDPTPVSDYSPMTVAPVFPAYWWGTPVLVFVSPFVPYDVENNRTDIIVFDPNELGYNVLVHDLRMRDWTENNSEIYTIALDKRSSILISNEGQGIAVAKNVQVNPGNQVVLPAVANIAIDGTVAEIDHSVSPYEGGS